MRWNDRRRSNNVEDRRGQPSSASGGGNLPLGLIALLLRTKYGFVIIIILVIASFMGFDFNSLTGQTSQPTQNSQQQSALYNEAADFSSVVLASTEDFWQGMFTKAGEQYRDPKLVLYTNSTTTQCGTGTKMMGPFYCPADQKIYLDLSFYNEMKNSLGGGGEFAQGYVISHEVGHHVQHLLGITTQMREKQQMARSKVEANRLSVRLELQADCFAGMWGRFIAGEGRVDEADLLTAIKTAQAIGDDRLQRQQQGYAVPDSFTHGTAEQRKTWFMRGYNSGDIKSCDTFASSSLN
ncbi:neutral zinc metallopeptidase [Proteus mirabilis]|uniref:KPN_02809 family neutral zinc metallopeptidase n=1 Tax=Proteus mirabilis TaxID=584 RepID=UPI001A31438D|nr:neutral zinc metallopeptidase [Proteus mirabilis]MBI6269116.1 neutral zinc metallopeptidase [Proteus mirabilis]MCI9729334.1 neutral zinc metallopeptidase [Proteus mirabilis]MCI9733089.1 neutral zinc metallopeptidase [Proteus mirabilis]MCI9736794.1 neutral zinc metallopeptidase [Proteus mirabilis]MCI9757585.1 neutral zinc metallopeptidase [Proteus mirabilis]